MKNRNWIERAVLVLASGSLLIGLSACNRNSTGGDVMASINGRKIYRSEVDKYYANQTAGSDKQPAGEQAVSLRLSILNELIETEILMQRAAPDSGAVNRSWFWAKRGGEALKSSTWGDWASRSRRGSRGSNVGGTCGQR